MNSKDEQRIEELESKVLLLRVRADCAQDRVADCTKRINALEDAWHSVFVKKEFWEERKPTEVVTQQ